MGGDCSQKLLLRRGWHSSPGRSRSSDQYAIHNSIAMIGSLRGLVSQALAFPRQRRRGCQPSLKSLFPNQFFFLLPVGQYLLFLKPVPPRPVSGRRHRTLAAWSPPVRRNGSLPRRR